MKTVLTIAIIFTCLQVSGQNDTITTWNEFEWENGWDAGPIKQGDSIFLPWSDWAIKKYGHGLDIDFWALPKSEPTPNNSGKIRGDWQDLEWIPTEEQTPITPYYDKDGITIQHIIDYGNKCYADSSQIMIEIPCPPNMPECMGVFKQVWIHKEPTFEGFVEYFRKKYQIK